MSPNSDGIRPPDRVIALADDLSGAAETAALLRIRSTVVLGPAAAPAPAEGEAVVLDLDTRHLSADEAHGTVAAALAGLGAAVGAPDTLVLKKTDSLLRGNLAAEAAAFAHGAEGLVIATALPAVGRTARGGVVHLHGTPLHETDAWRAESAPPPRSVAEALGRTARDTGIRAEVVPLAVVRGPAEQLRQRLRTLVADGRTPVCDGESDADLDAVVRAAARCGPGVRLMGTGGLAAAVGRLTDSPDAPSPVLVGGRVRPLLVVVGTAEPTAVAQIAQLTAVGAHHIALPPDTLGAPAGAPVLPGVAPGWVTVLSIDGSGGIRPGTARALVAGLARTVAALAAVGPPVTADLVLTGGETARRVLDALGVTQLFPLGQIQHGAVHSATADGRSVVTRPGSFGDADSLLRIVRTLRPGLRPHPVPQGEAL
ncbi:four-carbon acid sugar kinase family protein [Streptomyces sp. NBC_00370]|uniref:four-carbon acid sugar kinase family protein n=1 Tax=Streptomyces sp. NBC_00370 TaxID=2975728 RepID=UPI002E255995